MLMFFLQLWLYQSTNTSVPKEKVKQLVYDLIQPIDAIFNSIENIVDYSEVIGYNYIQHHSVSVAYIILKKTGKFKDGIRDCKRKTPN